MKIYFYQNNRQIWSDRRAMVHNKIIELIRASNLDSYDKDWFVEIAEVNEPKSYPQLRAIHKLCDLIIPHLEREHGIKYDRAKAKAFIKAEIGYVRDSTPFEVAIMLKNINIDQKHPDRLQLESFCRRIQQPESFALASKQKMIELIEQIQAYAAERDWNDVKLTNQDLIITLQYYR